VKRPPIVYVLWLDAHGAGPTEDFSPSDVAAQHRGWPTHTVGFLLRSDADGVTVCIDVQEPDEKGGEPTYRGRHFVPRGMVVRETLLGGRPRKAKARTDDGAT
jgi:hypothetical protein